MTGTDGPAVIRLFCDRHWDRHGNRRTKRVWVARFETRPTGESDADGWRFWDWFRVRMEAPARERRRPAERLSDATRAADGGRDAAQAGADAMAAADRRIRPEDRPWLNRTPDDGKATERDRARLRIGLAAAQLARKAAEGDDERAETYFMIQISQRLKESGIAEPLRRDRSRERVDVTVPLTCPQCGTLPSIRGDKLAAALDEVAAAGLDAVEVHALFRDM